MFPDLFSILGSAVPVGLNSVCLSRYLLNGMYNCSNIYQSW